MSKRDRIETLTLEQMAEVSGGMDQKLFTAMKTAVEQGNNVHWVHTGPHYPGSRHWSGRAIDVGGDPAARQKFFNWAKGTNPAELIYQNTFLKYGQRIGAIGGHEDHVHYSVD